MTGQEVVGVAEEPLGLYDGGDGRDGLLEGVDGGAVRAAHGDEDEGLEGQPSAVASRCAR